MIFVVNFDKCPFLNVGQGNVGDRQFFSDHQCIKRIKGSFGS